MSALGIIFSNIHDSNIHELTSTRTVASVPFGGRYRLIDFALSNMVNSGISRVGVITKANYQSLMDHIGSGKDWDLARHDGGLYILPPFGANKANTLYNTRLEALQNILGFLKKSNEDHVVMSDSDMVCSIDFKPIIKSHIKKLSDITLLYTKVDGRTIEGKQMATLEIDQESQRITEIFIDKEQKTKVNLYANICIIDRRLLINLITDAVSRGYKHFLSDIILANVKSLRISGYEHVGYFREMTSMQAYYDESLRFLNKDVRDEIFRQNNVYTKVKDSSPTKYGANAIVQNSLIADGCQIEGEVYNSIIFRGVKIARGTVVENSILMQNTMTGENVRLNCIITDKNVVIKDRRNLSGCETHPFFISKNVVI